ncbi:glycerate kinase family protein [Halobacillus hunanensis]|uniref:glycerate kinase family protein n=1 Tax=Halobacillus hunanensis TaxID=578214 RepID=UPI0009A642DC|nr:glycerate kinase [Halobacillus hunanensis]
MKVVMIPSGFKECLDPCDVAAAMEKGARRFNDDFDVEVVPMVDGGEGFAETLIGLKGGELIYREVTGPVGEKIISYLGVFVEGNRKTAVIEIAAVAGLKLVPQFLRNPLQTTSYGVGELILSALDLGVDHILIGCGDSGISDGGAGMAQALGARFYDQEHLPLSIKGGGDLIKARYIDPGNLDKRLGETQIDVACNWQNVLCGEKGVARVFGPQKGATGEQVELLVEALDHYACLIEEAVSKDVRSLPGSGASGGLGAGLIAFAGAVLHPRFDLIGNYIDIEQAITKADIVITAEGSLDSQTISGKVPSEVARIAKVHNIPVIIITGTIGKGAKLNYRAGIDAYLSITQKPTSLKKAMKKAPQWIEECTETVLRQVIIGYQLAEKKGGALYAQRNGRVLQKK